MDAVAVVLAAGEGSRMDSDLPKVLCRACGRPLIDYVLDALDATGVQRRLVVVGYRHELVREALAGRGCQFILQTERRGTGHAVRVCRDALRGHQGPVVVLTGDSPMVRPASLRKLLDEYARDRAACVLGTLHKSHREGLGRIVRDEGGEFVGIVEQKDASPEQLAITEVNMSTYVFHAPDLLEALERLSDDNRQGELYLTDCPGILRESGRAVQALPVLEPCEALSVNTLEELRLVEEELRRMGLG